jgi:hypothetical protein
MDSRLPDGVGRRGKLPGRGAGDNATTALPPASQGPGAGLDCPPVDASTDTPTAAAPLPSILAPMTTDRNPPPRLRLLLALPVRFAAGHAPAAAACTRGKLHPGEHARREPAAPPSLHRARPAPAARPASVPGMHLRQASSAAKPASSPSMHPSTSLDPSPSLHPSRACGPLGPGSVQLRPPPSRPKARRRAAQLPRAAAGQQPPILAPSRRAQVSKAERKSRGRRLPRPTVGDAKAPKEKPEAGQGGPGGEGQGRLLRAEPSTTGAVLAGLPYAPRSPLYPLQQTKSWRPTPEFDADWEKLKKERLEPWASGAAGCGPRRFDPGRGLLPLRRGPDFFGTGALPGGRRSHHGGMEAGGKMPPALRALGDGGAGAGLCATCACR